MINQNRALVAQNVALILYSWPRVVAPHSLSMSYFTLFFFHRRECLLVEGANVCV